MDPAADSTTDGTAALADRVAASVTACPAVAGLTAGPLATYLPGRIVPGVAIREGRIAVSVVARCQPLPDVIAQVRAAVAAVAPGVPADVHIADIETPGPA